jgi:prepilin-type N-terminal cleavage/methylation domain-containing protein
VNGARPGFTLIEALVALGLLAAVSAATVRVLTPSQAIFLVQPEVAAVPQQLRVAVDALATDRRAAGAGPAAGELAGALAGVVPPGAPVAGRGGATARDEAISVVSGPLAGAVGVVAVALLPGAAAIPLGAAPCQPVPGTACGFRAGMRVLVVRAGATEVRAIASVTPPDLLVLDQGLAEGYGPGSSVLEIIERVYRLEAAGGEPSLVRSENGGPALPVVDRVVDLRFDYFDATGAVPLGALADGPWVTSGPAPWRHDLDLWRVRRVRITVRAEAAPGFRGPAGPWFARPGTAAAGAVRVPDREVTVDVALRNTGPPP